VANNRAKDRAHFNATVLIEPFVLDSDNRLFHRLRDLITWDVRSILLTVEPVEFDTIAIGDHRALRGK